MYYNGTMMNVTSSTTTLTFTAPSLPDGVFTGNIVVMVTAINRYGIGPASDPATDEIRGAGIQIFIVANIYICVLVANTNIQQ